eukprot:INCI2974.2.p1 GENE.INCI2974.2~~INCI2974.2.p1  ORF type:complete len:2129 (-),score=317.69 INCI2974.2:401-6787(-)
MQPGSGGPNGGADGGTSKSEASDDGAKKPSLPAPHASASTPSRLRTLELRPGEVPGLLPEPKDFANNVSKTTKYTWWNFFPKALFFQFRRLGNLYFLVCGLLMLIGETDLNLYESPTSAWSTLGTLAAVLLVQLVIEALDDTKRASKDRETNGQPVLRWRHGLAHTEGQTSSSHGKTGQEAFQVTQWDKLLAGDIVIVRKNDSLPADVVVLASCYRDEGEFYIETKNIDGETTLKLRSSVMAFHEKCVRHVAPVESEASNESSSSSRSESWTPTAALRFVAKQKLTISFEEPNNLVYRFQAQMDFHDAKAAESGSQPVPSNSKSTAHANTTTVGGPARKQWAVSSRNLALRGSQLRNTPWVIGVVVYAGKDTKMVRNSKPTPTKQSTLDRQVNRAMSFILGFQFVVVSLSCGLGVLWTSNLPQFNVTDIEGTTHLPVWYLMPSEHQHLDSLYHLPYAVSLWIQFFILYNNFIPISLYVVSEMISLFHALMFNLDEGLVSADTGLKGVCRSTQLTQELGLVEYIFSDKTGTLTKNKMTFKACVVGSSVFYTEDSFQRPAPMPGRSQAAPTGALSESVLSPQKLASGRELGSRATAKPASHVPRIDLATDAPGGGPGRDGGQPRPSLVAPGFELFQFSALRNALRGVSPNAPPSVSALRTIAESKQPGASVMADDETGSQSNDDGDAESTPLAGTSGSVSDDIAEQHQLREFMLMMSVAHTVGIEKASAASDVPLVPEKPSGGDAADVEAHGAASLHAKSTMADGGSAVGGQSTAGPSGLVYQAESPDELALVRAAATAGFTFSKRSSGSVSVSVPGDASRNDSRIEKFKLLASNAFTSARKRQSIIVRRPDGQIQLMCKGADSHVLPRSTSSAPGVAASLDRQLEVFSKQGLRTLVYAGRIVSEDEFVAWKQRHQAASNTVGDRDAALAAVAEDMEQGMTIMGATAIEDELQDNVAQTIEKVHDAGIKLWILTGDKLETAVNIGFSCRVLLPQMRLVQLVLKDKDNVKACNSLARSLRDLVLALRDIARGGGMDDENDPIYKNFSSTTNAINLDSLMLESIPEGSQVNEPVGDWDGGVSPVATTDYEQQSPEALGCAHTRDVTKKDLQNGLALVVEGSALEFIFADESLRKCLLVASTVCQVVIACRVSPLQKAELVRLVKTGVKPHPVTLAIGDGANDVSMIQEAHVGVGVEGLEGRQAVNFSDFSVPEFQGLQRLLFVHGSWNYRRMAKTVRYFLLKNMVFPISIFFYNFYTGYSSTNPYSSWDMTLYNFFFTSFQIIFIGFLDRDVSQDCALRLPELYAASKLNLQLRPSAMLVCLVRAVCYAVLINLWPLLLYPAASIRGENDVLSFGTTMYTGLVLAMNFRAAMLTNSWTWLNALMLGFTIVLYYAYQIVHSHFWSLEAVVWGTAFYCYRSPAFWASSALTLVSCVAVDMLFEIVRLGSNMTVVDMGRIIDNYLVHFTAETARQRAGQLLQTANAKNGDFIEGRPSGKSKSQQDGVLGVNQKKQASFSRTAKIRSSRKLAEQRRQRQEMEHYIHIVQRKRVQRSKRTLTALVKRLSEGNLLSAAHAGTTGREDSINPAFQRRNTAPMSPLLSKKLSAHIMVLKSVVSSDDMLELSRHRNKPGEETLSPDQGSQARLEKKAKHGKKSKKHKHRKHGKHRHRHSKTSKHTVDEGSPRLARNGASQDAENEEEGSEASETGIEMQPMNTHKQPHKQRNCPKTNTSAHPATAQPSDRQTSGTPRASTIKQGQPEGTQIDRRHIKNDDTAVESYCTALCALERHRIRQQNLPGWRLIFTPQLCAIVILLSAVVVGVIGVAVAVASGNIVAHELFYNDSDAHLYKDAFAIEHHSGPNSAPSAVPQFDTTSAWVQCAANSSSWQRESASRSNRHQDLPCIAQVVFPIRMQSPVFVYYGIRNMYQNHLVYYSSFSIEQLHGDLAYKTSADCRSTFSTVSNKTLVPCGLSAQALFTDSFMLQQPGSALALNSSDIAWTTDTNHRFQNAEDWQTPDKQAEFEFLGETYNDVPSRLADELQTHGVEGQHFNVWMRSAAMPSFYNLWGRVDNVDALEANVPYNLTIIRSFNAARFGGTKSLLFVSGVCCRKARSFTFKFARAIERLRCFCVLRVCV